ncbi:MAG: DNA-binding protein [Deltaproteobacteria bacterium]|nr:DNA-binding protein [Deltaproteobacteria bacterium]
MGTIFSEGKLNKVVMIRVPPGSDIIEAIEETCRALDIRSGAISSCIGSLQKASLLIAVPLKNKPGAGYSDPINLDGPLELLSAQGTIGQEQNGDLSIHMHGLLSDQDGNVHGGHLIKGENPVLITCEIMISQVGGVKVVRTYDPDVDMEVFIPSQR